MKFSYNWIKELVPHLEATPEQLSQAITIKTAESEGVQPYAPTLKDALVARVLRVTPISASKNVKAEIDLGHLGHRTVVCGAPNCREGLMTAYLPLDPIEIAGVVSNGMLASGEELGVNRDHAGIVELVSAGEPGAPLGLHPDFVIEIDNKSLTHRPDLWGHFGMARETAAIFGTSLRDPVDLSLLGNGTAAIDVTVQEPTLCPRYSALVIENIAVRPSPLWLQYRLQAVGLNPINNVVDVTNWVLAELAQPMHAFDADKLEGGIIVRRAAKGESISALNAETYNLRASDLVIADRSGAIAVAGVIGGAQSAITSSTTRIVLESATFHAGTVRKTSAALKLRTDASMRFEKSQDPANTLRGLARALALLRETCPALRVVQGVADVPHLPAAPAPIELHLDRLQRKLGRRLETSEVERILTALEFGVQRVNEKALQVTIPSWRATKDISMQDDLVEEIGRMIGYGSITPQPPALPAVVPKPNPLRAFQRHLREMLSARGYHEVYNYSFLSEEVAARFHLPPDETLRVLNPIASDQNILRTTLVPGLVKNMEDNARFLDEFRCFELGSTIRKREADEPNEQHRLGVALFRREAASELFFELKRIALGIAPDGEFKPVQQVLPYMHPVRNAEVMLNGAALGMLFELHPSFVERGRGCILDLNVDALLQLSGAHVRYQPLSRFPSSSFDLSILADARTLVGEIQQHLRDSELDHLQQVEFVRQYSGPPLADGTKSVSYRITVGANDRTLSSGEISEVRAALIGALRGKGYELRV